MEAAIFGLAADVRAIQGANGTDAVPTVEEIFALWSARHAAERERRRKRVIEAIQASTGATAEPTEDEILAYRERQRLAQRRAKGT